MALDKFPSCLVCHSSKKVQAVYSDVFANLPCMVAAINTSMQLTDYKYNLVQSNVLQEVAVVQRTSCFLSTLPSFTTQSTVLYRFITTCRYR